MTKVILLVSALAFAPVASLAADHVGSGDSKAAPTSAQCLLDPTACTVVARRANR